jgi:5-formyltetrahydrofolate cyclo-ligase
LNSTSNPPAAAARQALRRELRARRRAIQGAARRQAARQLARRVDAARLLRPGRRVGLYLATTEEIDTAPLLRLARARGCHIALPRVVSLRHDRMRFHDWTGGSRRGAFGIREPFGGTVRAARELDVVFLPLVGFDSHGNRIGMGRGFYDRHFAHRLHMSRYRRPLLVGLAYDVQQVATLMRAAHDVPLDAIVTQSSIRRFHGSGT